MLSTPFALPMASLFSTITHPDTVSDFFFFFLTLAGINLPKWEHIFFPPSSPYLHSFVPSPPPLLQTKLAKQLFRRENLLACDSSLNFTSSSLFSPFAWYLKRTDGGNEWKILSLKVTHLRNKDKELGMKPMMMMMIAMMVKTSSFSLTKSNKTKVSQNPNYPSFPSNACLYLLYPPTSFHLFSTPTYTKPFLH